MAKKKIILFLVCIYFTGVCQNFGSLPFMENSIYSPYYLEKVLTDSIHDKLIVSSKHLRYADTKKVRGICSWNGSVWDSLAGGINTHAIMNNPLNPNGTVLGGIEYNGKFLVGGIFESIGGVNATSLATWDGIKWDSLPVRAFKFLDYGGFVYGFTKYNNKLYIYGNFDTIQGQKASGLATYDGVSFQPVNLPIRNQSTILDMKVYNGELFICGVFSYSTSIGTCILKFDGSNWVNVGNGIIAANGGISSMAVYNNELYAGGYFLNSGTNVSNIIAKWNGTNWQDVSWGYEYQNGGIWKLQVYHNKLYAFGTFDLAGNIKASKIAAYDGNQWCTFADSLDENIYSVAIYHDTMFVAGAFKSISGDTTMKCIAKLKQPTNFNACGVVGIKTNSFEDELVKIFPNPFTSQITVNTSNNELKKLIITNTLGQIAYQTEFYQSNITLDLPQLPSGAYSTQLYINTNFSYRSKLIKQ